MVEYSAHLSYYIQMKRNILLVILLQLVVSCAPFSQAPQHSGLLAYVPEKGPQSLIAQFHPYFLVEKYNKPYNRIGTPTALLLPDGKQQISIDPNEASVYTETRTFTTAHATYTNLIYRVHFTETPLPHLTSGKNVGLLIYITLDAENRVLLITTLHACGCYLAFVPVNDLNGSVLPDNWPTAEQTVYGKQLPAGIDPPAGDERLIIDLDSKTHRVRNILS